MRAFTARRNKPEIQISTPMYIGRAASQRGGRPVVRAQISSPVTLISTSNVLILNNAEAIAGLTPVVVRNVSSGSSVASSPEDCDQSSNGSVRNSETMTDASSVDDSPISSEPEPNHLSCYFKPAVDTDLKSVSQSPFLASSPLIDSPTIPQRGPSHSKKAHENFARTRSIRRMLSPPPFHDIARSSADIFDSSQDGFVEAPTDPFGCELAQLDEVAEEFGQVVRDAESDADLTAMESHGLAHFAASDYMSEIQSLIYDTFADRPSHDWI